MRTWLFILFYATTLVAVAITSIGLLANWGIWIESKLVQAGQELPLLKTLVMGVIIAIVGVVVDIARRLFMIIRPPKDKVSEIYLDLIGQAILLPTANKDEANLHYGFLDDYMKNYRNDELVETIREKVKKSVKENMHKRYGGAQEIQHVSEVLERNPHTEKYFKDDEE